MHINPEIPVLLADSLNGLNSIQLSYKTPNPSNPLVKVFIVTNLRRDEELEFDTAEEAFTEYLTDVVGEIHGHLVNHDGFVTDCGRESLGIPAGYGDKFLQAFNTAISHLFDEHNAGRLIHTELPNLNANVID